MVKRVELLRAPAYHAEIGRLDAVPHRNAPPLSRLSEKPAAAIQRIIGSQDLFARDGIGSASAPKAPQRIVVPRAIEGTVPAPGVYPEAPADAWYEAVVARHYDAVGVGQGKSSREIFASQIQRALQAPASQQTSGVLLQHFAQYPGPSGASVRFSTERFAGRDLYCFLRTSPHATRPNMTEVDLQLFSIEGRIAGELSNMPNELMPK